MSTKTRTVKCYNSEKEKQRETDGSSCGGMGCAKIKGKDGSKTNTVRNMNNKTLQWNGHIPYKE